MILLDYFFYRIYQFYKTNKESTPVFMGCMVMSVTMFASLMSCAVILEILFRKDFRLNKFIAVPIILALTYMLYKRFANKHVVDALTKKYKDEEKVKKRRRGYVVFLYLIIVICIPILFGFLKHNLQLDIGG